jgi:GntR family transcriptional regulator/MocR family aminotransferase
VADWEFAFELDRARGTPIAQQITRALAAEIQRGRLRPGHRLPGSRTLARTLHVHRQTVVSAIDELIAEGWLVTKPASGTFVAAGFPDQSVRRRGGNVRVRRPERLHFPLRLAAAPAPELPRIAPPQTILLSGTLPDLRLVPVELIARAYRRVLRRSGSDLLSYTHPAGLPRLRQALATMLSSMRGLAVNPDDLVVTRGSQMALALTARALIRAGDTVAVEHPGYRPAWEVFRLAGAEIVPVPIDEHGLDVNVLQRIVARHTIRAVYVTPHHQFPTTVTLSGPRRVKLLELAAEHRFAIIEDDYDHEFHYAGRPVLPLASVDTEGLVIYIGTLSKVLAPGLRLGFVVGASDFIERLIAYRSFIDLQGDAILESAIAELLDEGLIQRHVRKTRRIYHSRSVTLATELRRQLGEFLTFRNPSGGTAIWVRTRDARTMTGWAEAARLCGVIFDAGSTFTLNGAPTPGARLGFACLTEDELSQAVRRLATATARVHRRPSGRP